MTISALPIVFCILLLLYSSSGVCAKQSRGVRRQTLEVWCDSVKTSLDRYVFVDIDSSAATDLSLMQLNEIGGAFMDSYNSLSRDIYCDLFFRKVSGVSAAVYERTSATRTRVLLTIDAECRGCSEQATLLSDNNRRDLAPDDRILKKSRSSSKDGDDDDDDDDSSESMCRCPSNHNGFGTPPHGILKELMVDTISVKAAQGDLPSDAVLVSVQEVEPFLCPPETEFESEVSLTLGASVAPREVPGSEFDALEGGFKIVYNGLQDETCDMQGKRIDSVDTMLSSFRKLSSEDDRQLQVFNVAQFLVFLNYAIRGRCRFCAGFNPIFGNDGIRRVLQESDQTGLCFCATGALDNARSGTVTAATFNDAYNDWIDRERAQGKLTAIVNSAEVVQVDEFAPSSSPSQLDSRTDGGTATLTEEPSAAPAITPSASPSTSPSAEPSSAPSSAPSSSPSDLPSAEPSSSPSGSPSSMPSAAPSTHPSSNPSSWPSSAPSTTPSTEPSEKPSSSPSSSPTTFPSSSPSITPSDIPSTYPSVSPSTSQPSILPTDQPSFSPSTSFPSVSPSVARICPVLDDLEIPMFDQTFNDGLVDGWFNAKYEGSSSSHTPFLGLFEQGDPFPFRVVNVDLVSVNSVVISLTLYEIGFWNGSGPGGRDTISLEVEGGGITDVIGLGWFNGAISEESTYGFSDMRYIEWSMESVPISLSPQGFNVNATDQMHRVTFDVPSEFFEASGTFRFKTMWEMVGEVEEFLGIDDVIATACVDAAPSDVPSATPSIGPSSTPTMPPTRMPVSR